MFQPTDGEKALNCWFSLHGNQSSCSDHNIVCAARVDLPKIHKIVFSFDKRAVR